MPRNRQSFSPRRTRSETCKRLDAAAAVGRRDPQIGADLRLSLAWSASVRWNSQIGVRRHEVQPENIDPARPQVLGHGFEVALGGGFGQEVPEAVQEAVSGVGRLRQGEVGHVGQEDLGRELSPLQPFSQEVQCLLVQVQACHLVAAGGHFDHQPPRAAGRLQQPANGKIAILPARGLDERRLQGRFVAKREVVVFRMIVPVADNRFGRGQGSSLRVESNPF